MTREEAITIIQECMDKGFKYSFYTLDEYNEALTMAIKALEQEPSGDVISREPFTDSTICEGFSCDECSFNRKDKGGCILEERVMNLPSVKQEPKTGHWIEDDMTYCGVDLTNYKCDKCGEIGGSWRKGLKPDKLPKYCMNCGCRMVEPQEERNKE